MASLLFKNALNLTSQKTPPIWFMRQAGRYHSHYQKLKENYTFEQLCKIPELASEVACGPVKEFDFDVAILFSDILFPLEGLGMPLHFSPGPIFDNFITEDNYKKYSNIDSAIEHMEFQREAIKITREQLPSSKSLIGFVGGLFTLLRFAIDKKKPLKKIEKFHFVFLINILLPLIKRNIQLQLEAGAEIVMMFDSGLTDLDEAIFLSKYIFLIEDIAKTFPGKVGYYSKGKNFDNIYPLFDYPFAGIGIDHTINIEKSFSSYKKGFIQGNFDENKLLLDIDQFSTELEKYCDQIKSISDLNGWVCGLGHGINKNTSEKNVHLFIDIIRKRFS